jgi:hypothetical protein
MLAYSLLPAPADAFLCTRQVCEEEVVSIKEPARDFKVADALTAFNVTQLSGAGDISLMAAGAQTLTSLSAFARDSSSDGSVSATEAKQVQTAISAKTGAMISSLASSAGGLIDDPQTMSQVGCVEARLSFRTCSTLLSAQQVSALAA